MDITIQLPDDIAGIVSRNQPDLSRLALEAMAVAIYSRGLISHAQVGKVLGLESRFEVDDFLHDAGASRPYDVADYDRDLETLAKVLRR